MQLSRLALEMGQTHRIWLGSSSSGLGQENSSVGGFGIDYSDFYTPEEIERRNKFAQYTGDIFLKKYAVYIVIIAIACILLCIAVETYGDIKISRAIRKDKIKRLMLHVSVINIVTVALMQTILVVSALMALGGNFWYIANYLRSVPGPPSELVIENVDRVMLAFMIITYIKCEIFAFAGKIAFYKATLFKQEKLMPGIKLTVQVMMPGILTSTIVRAITFCIATLPIIMQVINYGVQLYNIHW